jgi:hypothetical protein
VWQEMAAISGCSFIDYFGFRKPRSVLANTLKTALKCEKMRT